MEEGSSDLLKDQVLYIRIDRHINISIRSMHRVMTLHNTKFNPSCILHKCKCKSCDTAFSFSENWKSKSCERLFRVYYSRIIYLSWVKQQNCQPKIFIFFLLTYNLRSFVFIHFQIFIYIIPYCRVMYRYSLKETEKQNLRNETRMVHYLNLYRDV